MNQLVDRTEVTLVIPEAVAELSVSAVKLCELFATALLSSREAVIDIGVDAKNGAVTSNDSRVKEVASMILKTKQLTSFYEQLYQLTTAEQSRGVRSLRLVVGGVRQDMAIQEQQGLPDLRLRVNKVPVD